MKIPRLLASAATTVLFTACQTTAPETTAPATTAPDRFALADTDRSGSLTRAEMSDAQVTATFNSRDANKDGRLTKQEWLVPGDEAGPVQFAERDADKDGIVTLDEAKDWGRKSERSATLLKDADTNGDGKVDRAEAIAYYGKSE
jgi:Ca2+-binding EF-hand superfamily protein